VWSEEDATAEQALPPEETGPVPVHVTAVTPRFFGVAPPTAVLALAVASVAAAIVLLVRGHLVVGSVLLGVALVLLAAFFRLARRLPRTAAGRVTLQALGSSRAWAGAAAEALTAHAAARADVLRLRRELDELAARRRERLRELGEAVYAEEEHETDSIRARVRELDELIEAKEAEMARIVAEAAERIRRARLQVRGTELLEPPQPAPMPEPMPEPYPPPTEPPQPARIPEPSPVPSDPPGPVHVPEPTPEPAPDLPTEE
jgi:hypothetical protein